MASQFENAGLGMFGGERRFAFQGKDSPLRFLAGALLSPKSGAVPLPEHYDGQAVDPLNAVAPNAVSAVKPPDPVTPVDETAIRPDKTIAPVQNVIESDVHPDVPAVLQDLGFEPTTTPIKQQNVVSEKISGISPDILKPDRSQDAATLQALYAPNPSVAPPIGQGGGGGGGEAASKIASTVLSLFLG